MQTKPNLQPLNDSCENATMKQTKGSKGHTSKPFDMVFRTMAEKMPELLIPLINEAFQADYPLNSEVIQLRNEPQKETSGIITDSLIRIRDTVYHIECQSINDTTMAIRMFEYDFMIAVENAVASKDGAYNVTIPKSCVLYVRSNKNTPTSHIVHVRFPDGNVCDYKAPCICVNDYSLDEIFEKELLFFLPYYLSRYEKFKGAWKEARATEQCLSEAQTISKRLNELAEESGKKTLLIDLTKLIIRLTNYLFATNPSVKEGVEHIMSVGTYMLESERLEAKGRAEGKIEGKLAGRIEMLMNLYSNGGTDEQAIHLLEATDAEIAEAKRRMNTK